MSTVENDKDVAMLPIGSMMDPEIIGTPKQHFCKKHAIAIASSILVSCFVIAMAVVYLSGSVNEVEMKETGSGENFLAQTETPLKEPEVVGAGNFDSADDDAFTQQVMQWVMTSSKWLDPHAIETPRTVVGVPGHISRNYPNFQNKLALKYQYDYNWNLSYPKTLSMNAAVEQISLDHANDFKWQGSSSFKKRGNTVYLSTSKWHRSGGFPGPYHGQDMTEFKAHSQSPEVSVDAVLAQSFWNSLSQWTQNFGMWEDQTVILLPQLYFGVPGNAHGSKVVQGGITVNYNMSWTWSQQSSTQFTLYFNMQKLEQVSSDRRRQFTFNANVQLTGDIHNAGVQAHSFQQDGNLKY